MMVDKKNYTIHDKLPLNDAAKLITWRVKKLGEGERTAEDRVRKRIKAAAKEGKLIREKDSTFIFGNLIEWARGIWPDKFDNLPSNSHLQASASVSSRGVGDLDVFIKPPESPEQKDEMILSLQKRVVELEEEIKQLKPDAEKYRARSVTNTKSGGIRY